MEAGFSQIQSQISIFSNSQEVWFRTAQAAEKGGLSDSKTFRQASYLTSNSKETQANTLIYSMRVEADGILHSFELSNNNRKKYNTVSNKSKAHFVKQKNPIYEWRTLICVDRKKEKL